MPIGRENYEPAYSEGIKSDASKLPEPRKRPEPRPTIHWAYRVLEQDDEGDPLDFGMVSAGSLAEAQELVTAHLIDCFGDDVYEALPVRFYAVTRASGVWQTDTITEAELELTK
jgi:hypothetical protein